MVRTFSIAGVPTVILVTNSDYPVLCETTEISSPYFADAERGIALYPALLFPIAFRTCLTPYAPTRYPKTSLRFSAGRKGYL